MFMIGERIEGFVITRKLASGGMGAVYVAQHQRFPDKLSVVKVLLPEFAAHPEYRARFEREAAAASRLEHPNILEITNFGALPTDELWLMMPYLRGRSLSDYLQDHGRLNVRDTLVIMLQLCSALEHAHRLGIVHRDIKPENIFISATDREPLNVKLLDFGIAKILNSHIGGLETHRGATVGTPAYMAPEQHAQQPERVSPRCDIYSAGIVTALLISGELPFGPPDQPAVILYTRQKYEPPALQGLPPEWDNVVRTALEVDPEKRWKSAREFGLMLAKCAPDGDALVAKYAPEFLRDSAIVRTRPTDLTLHGRRPLPTPAAIVTLPTPPTWPRPRPMWQFVLFALVVFTFAAITMFGLVRHWMAS